MDFELSDEHRALRQTVRELCVDRLPLIELAGREGPGFDDRLWADLVSLGVFCMRDAPPEGAGFGMTEAAVVYHELGRALVPGPIVWSHLASPLGLKGVVCGLDTQRVGPLVEYLAVSDLLLFVGDKVRAIEVRSIDKAAMWPAPPLDPLTPAWRVDDAIPVGDVVGDAEAAHTLRRDGAVLVAAQLAGIAAAVTDLAAAYARQREQFGRPIGSFQAVKHLLADMLVRAEIAQVAVEAAGVAIDGRSTLDVERAVASAKVVAGESAIRNSETCIQIHGGIGFSWELSAHLFLKRAWILDTQFGTPAQHALTVSDHA
ncbi:MAG: acyl-CoA dehydrogenase family protein [Mycobacterium sp.]|uniref:acyl-CoA dehydrogenase family protein n=1 Tax=Mycobacterium sp. TaxID=1785 RepID=UPI003C313991